MIPAPVLGSDTGVDVVGAPAGVAVLVAVPSPGELVAAALWTVTGKRTDNAVPLARRPATTTWCDPVLALDGMTTLRVKAPLLPTVTLARTTGVLSKVMVASEFGSRSVQATVTV